MKIVEDPRAFSCYTFSLGNSDGPDDQSVPALLRRVADAIEELGEIDIIDIAFVKWPIEGEGWYPFLTLYYNLPSLHVVGSDESEQSED